MSEERDASKAANPDASAGELAKIMGAQWQSMPSEEKKRFSQQALAGKRRYEEAKAHYDAELRAYIAAYPESAEARAAAEAATAREKEACVANGTALGGHPLSGPASKLSKTDAKMVSKRRLRDRVEDVPYDFELVPKAKGCSLRSGRVPADGSMLAGSALVRVDDREVWAGGLTEILQICNEAAWRKTKAEMDAGTHKSADVVPPHDAKPLMLEYIADRLDTDDPIWGYQVRTRAEGWLQGFVIVTDFTTWASYFRFDSQAPSNGITADDVEQRVTDYAVVDAFYDDVAAAPQNHDDDDDDDPETASRSVLTAAIPPLAPGAAGSSSSSGGGGADDDGDALMAESQDSDAEALCVSVSAPVAPDSGPVIASTTPLLERGGVSLASLMEEEPRWGEPDVEGVVFHTIAEISLLGALGCGAWLLQLVLQELKATGRYKYAILQATDQAIPFYESMGFTRVGCVARHARGKKDEEEEMAEKAKEAAKAARATEAKKKAAADKEAKASKKRGSSKDSKKKGSKASSLTSASSSSSSPKVGSSGQGKKRPSSTTSSTSSSPSSSTGLKDSKPKAPARRRKGGLGADPPLMPNDRGEEILPEDAFYWLTIYMSYLVQQLRLVDSECIFHHPVNLDEVPDYLRIIPSHTPMDLSTMQRKVIAHRYENLVAFLDDVKLIAANALSYNQGTSIIYRRAKKLKSEAISLVHSFRMEVCAHEAVYVLCIFFLCDLFRNVFFLSHAPTPP